MQYFVRIVKSASLSDVRLASVIALVMAGDMQSRLLARLRVLAQIKQD